jgi:aspartate racemase
MGRGILLNETKNNYSIIKKFVNRGAQLVIFGCTEIPLLIAQADSPLPVFDTTFIHARAAIDFAL